MKKKKQRKNSDLENLTEEIEVEAELDDSEEAALAEKEKREKKRRQIINRNSRKYIIITTILSVMAITSRSL